jgi:hypothetical protein
MRQLFRLVASIAALIFTVPSVEAQESGWPEVFSPFVLRTLNLTIDAGDWNTIRHDTTNEIEVPASF